MGLIENLQRDVFYLESLPRLAFTDNMYSITNAVWSLGLRGRYSTTAFWYQGIQDLLEKACEYGYKYALTIDYDTWFTEYHIIDLYELMEKHTEYLALFPIQPRRGQLYPMAGTFVDPGGDRIKLTRGDFIDGVCPADTGHFGLTMFRLSELKKLSKPWLISKYDKNGSWGEGKKDADVNFWIKCKNEGFKVGVAEVYIGHIQLFCSFSRPKEHKFRTVNIPIQSIHERKKLPEWAEPRSSTKERKENENGSGTAKKWSGGIK